MNYEYKPMGITMNQFLKIIRKNYDDEITYLARLDPMAKGVVPIIEKSRFKEINSLIGDSKEYNVTVMIGIKTDSDDVLGIVDEFDESYFGMKKSEIDKILNVLVNNEYINTEFKQEYHYFSSKRISYRRRGRDRKCYHKVKLNSVSSDGFGKIKLSEWIRRFIKYFDSIDREQNFRQEEIKEQWLNVMENYVGMIPYINLKLNVSSGFFVRQYVRDMSNLLKIPLMAWEIERVKVIKTA